MTIIRALVRVRLRHCQPAYDPSKVNLAIYNNLPGIQPPTLDLDGRDLSAEGLSMVNTAAPAIVLPGMPTVAPTPQPFPSPAPTIH
jgi:hypothetical protein